MTRMRSLVGQNAKVLRDCLVERMASATPAECGRIRKAMALCDKFLNSRQADQKGLERLKSQVVMALWPPGTKPPAKFDLTKPAAAPASSSSPRGTRSCSLPGINDRQVTPGGASVDLTMPQNIRLERTAYARGIGFAEVAKAQDKLAAQDDVERARNKVAHRAKTRSLLDGQMKEIAARKEKEAQEAADEARKLNEDIARHQAEQEAEALAARQAQDKMRQQLTSQVEENWRARYNTHMEAMRAANLERKQAEMEAKEEADAARRRKEENLRENKKFSKEMMAAMDEKKERLARQQEEDRLYVLECKKRMDEEQQAREAAVAARKAKMDAAFKRGGGEALEVGLKERALEDERRAAEQQAAYESKALALQKQKQAERRNKTQEQMEHLKQQMADKQKRIQEANEEKRRLGQLAAEEARNMKQMEKDAKAAQKVAKAKELQQLKEKYLEEQKNRYHAAKDDINPRDLWLHQKVAQGKARGFTTLKSVQPGG